jgi:hypothetical protein
VRGEGRERGGERERERERALKKINSIKKIYCKKIHLKNLLCSLAFIGP